eukprot:1415425-Alexandrium_andersonii.AAC.1
MAAAWLSGSTDHGTGGRRRVREVTRPTQTQLAAVVLGRADSGDFKLNRHWEVIDAPEGKIDVRRKVRFYAPATPPRGG